MQAGRFYDTEFREIVDAITAFTIWQIEQSGGRVVTQSEMNELSDQLHKELKERKEWPTKV